VTIRNNRRPSTATVLAGAALAVSIIAAVLALEQPASATGRLLTIGPYVADLDVHDTTGAALHLGPGEIKQGTAKCPPGQTLVAGGFEAHGTLSKLGSVVSITSSHPEGSFNYKVPATGGTEEVETSGPRDWAITAVDPGLAQAVDIQPWASCLQLLVKVQVTSLP
jgi:hypothetical protein